VLSLLFSQALSQPAWFAPKRLSTAPFGSAYLSGRTRPSEAGPNADSHSRLRKLVRASGRPLLLPGRPTLGPHASLRGLLFDALRSLWWSWPCRRGGMGGIIQIGNARGMRILSGLGGDHQCVVALDLQLAAIEYRVVAEVGVEANVPAGLRFLVAHRVVRGVPHQLVQAGDGDQLIPIHPANTPDTLVTRPADTPAQQEVLFSPVEAGP